MQQNIFLNLNTYLIVIQLIKEKTYHINNKNYILENKYKNLTFDSSTNF